MKRIVCILLSFSLLLCAISALTSCGARDEKTIRIGASPTPHAEILAVVREVLSEVGYTLDVVVYDDYVLPNMALEQGELDANYFQHLPYLEDFNAKNNTHLASVAKIHYEPFGVYGKGIAELGALADGATVLVPSDSSNQTRALLLLAQEGLITLAESAGIQTGATLQDVLANEKHLNIAAVEAATIPAQLRNGDNGTIAVINGNYAIGAGLSVATDALAIESNEGAAAQTYANIVAVKDGTQSSAKIGALVAAFADARVAAFIRDTYSGAVVPMG